ncbi:MAG: class I SAM-dependent methyltransferase [Chthoniobacterales bacterium]
MPTIDFVQIAQYREEYPRLATALGKPGAAPAPGEVEFLTEVTARDWRGIGMLPPADVLFAAAVTSILAPPSAIELGTASGFSAAIIAKMMALREAERGAAGKSPLLHTIDKRADFAPDPTKPIGFAIDLLTPELRERIVLHPLHDSSFCQELPPDHALRFAFIDGNHQHPWPLVDVLRIQERMAGGWILLHDIDLPATIARAQAEGRAGDLQPAAGAKHVFDFWPDAKISSGNIGVVRVPSDRRSLGRLIATLRDLPAEVSPGSWTKRWREIDRLPL